VANDTFETEVAAGERFRFGRNWASFLAHLDDDRIAQAERSLKEFLGVTSLAGKRWLDVGSGSGLFSLAARRLGATVHSFDFDPDSVGCTQGLRERFRPDDAGWTVERGSALDADYLARLGTFDFVYAWGVLHHTGSMWKAIDHVSTTVAPGGRLWLMLYLDEGWKSKVWLGVKKTYCSGPPGRMLILGVFFPYYALRGGVEDLLHLRDPRARYREYRQQRGMSMTHDWVDWLGGYPYEVARPDQAEAFLRQRGFALERQRAPEYLFRRA
jgi:2-polyprenyl-6-hydroxyphenyl methylase/3-demethylubiquinone-9 3-methyltransferase